MSTEVPQSVADKTPRSPEAASTADAASRSPQAVPASVGSAATGSAAVPADPAAPASDDAPACTCDPNGPADDTGAAASPNEAAWRFWTLSHALDALYDRYARTQGLTYTSLAILDILYHEGPRTQKEICEETFLPKQTVNSIISSFYRQELLVMTELPQDRRAKVVQLSEKGLELARSVIGLTDQAEESAFAELTASERKQVLNAFGRLVSSYETLLSKWEQARQSEKGARSS